MDVLYEPYRNLVKAIVARTLYDIARGWRARRFQMPILNNRHLAMIAYDEYLQSTRKKPPWTYLQWLRQQHRRASTALVREADAIEALADPGLRQLCSIADVYMPPDCTEAIETIHRRVERGEM